MRIIGNRGNTARKVQAVASGALASGDTVIVNADGTVSVISGVAEGFGSPVAFDTSAGTDISSTYDANAQKVVIIYRDFSNSSYGAAVVGTVSGTSISFGTPVIYQSSSSSRRSITYDANAQKVVVAYTDTGNSNYGTARVGTVSGTSISFGNTAVFEAATTAISISATYDSTAQKVVIVYVDQDNSNKGTARVGTVSGTSISFGPVAVFDSGQQLSQVAATFDANAQKVVIAYKPTNVSQGRAIVGTVSGTSISYGTLVAFEGAAVLYLSATYDANAQKVVVSYQDQGNSNYGTAIVGTVSGTSISFGTAVVFNSAATSYIGSTFDSDTNKVAIAYNDAGNSNYGTLIIGSASGTSISFETPAVFETATSNFMATTYDTNSQKVVIAYSDVGNGSRPTSIVFQTASTTLTSENFIGFASNGYPDTAGATIDVQGAINDRQSGLTAGQAYYIQTDGTLTTTAGDPSVFAGTAISATKMIVKG